MARTPESVCRLPLRENSTGQGLLLSTLALLALGVVMVHSAVASVANPGPWYSRVDVRHTIFAAAALLTLCAAWPCNYHWLERGRILPVLPTLLMVLAMACALLVYVPGVGHAVGGYRRWIRVGPAEYSLGFQPSEILKLAMVIFFSAWLTRKTVHVRSFTKAFLPALLLMGLCVLLVIREDFGTAILLSVSGMVTLLLAGVPWYYLLSLVPPGAGAFYVLVVRSEYRWARIQAWFDPWSQTNPSAYQPRQSLLAIISGGWFGAGPGGGMQKLGFLPEDSTDFIFSVFCEEWGFIGAVLLMGLVIVWIWHARRSAVRAGDRFGRVLAGSLGFLIAMQMVLHIAVDLVAAPPTGMTLPFVSAGGTALVIMAGAAAIMISVTAHQRAEAERSNPSPASARGKVAAGSAPRPAS